MRPIWSTNKNYFKFWKFLRLFQIRWGLHFWHRFGRICNIQGCFSNQLSLLWDKYVIDISFKDLLTRHKMVAADFLETNFDRVFTLYQTLLSSDNYVTKRQSLKLLGELLLDRHNYSVSLMFCSIDQKVNLDCWLLQRNFQVMTLYISNPENLKLMMNMLKEKSRNIQYEAFHVFKVVLLFLSKLKQS